MKTFRWRGRRFEVKDVKFLWSLGIGDMEWNRLKFLPLSLVGLLVTMLCLSMVPLVSAESFTKYATTSGGEGFASPQNVTGPPDGARSESWMGNEGYLWAGGYATEGGTITGVVINVMYRVDIPAVDDTTTLKYSLDGGVSFGSYKLTWVPKDTSWTVKTLDITSDTSVNGGSWDWTDISNLRIYVQNTVVGGGDWPYDDATVQVDAFYVTITTSTGTATTPAPAAFNFTLSASPASLTVQQTDSVSTTVSVKLTSGTAETVLLSGLWVGTTPSGVTPSLSPPSGNPNFSSTLAFSASLTATTGTFTYQVKGIGGSVTRTVNVSITVTKLTPPVAPALLSPDNGATLDTNTPTFDWADVVASTYTLEIATDEDFSHVILTKMSNESTVTLSQLEALSYGTLYYWRVRGTNAAGVGDWSPIRLFAAKVGAPKVLGLKIEAGARYVNSTTVQLSITALNAAQMSFSSDGITWSDWEDFQSTKSFTIPPPDGTKSVYVRVRDAAGDIGQSFMSSVILDQTPPVTAHFLSGDMEGDAFRGSVVVTLSVEDLTSGVLETRYRVDNGEWKTGNTFVLAKDGRHTVEYYSTDAAGNREAPKVFEVTVFTPTAIPPVILQYWWAILSIIVVVGIVTTFAFQRMRVASRLKQIKKEKAELPKLKRQAEIKYFKEGSISRETYDKLIAEYERRRAELEKEERLLRERAKREVRKREPKKARGR